MKQDYRMKLSALAAVICLTAVAAQAIAQQGSRQTSRTETRQSPAAVDDLSITANVSARELKFEIVPNPTVDFPGQPKRETVWEADRQNLPKPVEPGVTYRNIGIQLRISSRFADIEHIVAEALGEIPISDAAPQNQTPNAVVQQKTPAPQNQNKKP